MIHKSFGKRRGYLQFIDLVGHGLGGVTISAALIVGLQAFAAEYPAKLTAQGLTDELEPYAPVYSQIRERFYTTCSDDLRTVDCREMKRFLREAYADVGGEMTLVRYKSEIPAGVSEETARLLTEYRTQWQRAPAPILAIKEAFRHINYLIFVPLLLGWMLGMHRRWILWRHALNVVRS
jgi:hypothetical protein